MTVRLYCRHFEEKTCHSCPHLGENYIDALNAKALKLKATLAPYLHQCEWQEPIPSPLSHFRNKAKMAVSGRVERSLLGMIDPQKREVTVDLCDCPLYPEDFLPIFTHLKDFIARAGLVPYQIDKDKGELKYLLLTQSRQNGEIMLRFVLRSTEKRPLIERELPHLLAKIPALSVVSLNIQPKRAAILEGSEEIFLTPQHFLPESFNEIPLFIRPQGFFQTNPVVSEKLYATAQNWAREAFLPTGKTCEIWDLFCGSGGFGLHLAEGLKKITSVNLTGVEISPTAIACAKQSGALLGLTGLNFTALDVENYAFGENAPDIVVVNPPRRGIGAKMADFLNRLKPRMLIYSSCEPKTMAKDLAHLTFYRLAKVQLFDMFPHTDHAEVLGLLVLK